MRECNWTQEQIERALSADYNEPLMHVDPREYVDRREVPKYTLAEVALYLGIRETTLHNWFFGRRYSVGGEALFSERLVAPALHNPRRPALSFYNLAEAQVLAATRQKWELAPKSDLLPSAVRPKFGEKPRRRTEVRISMQAVRRAILYVSKDSPSHPLISQYFFTDGKSLFIKKLEDQLGRHLTINVSRLGQLGFSSILDLYLDRLDRDQSGWPIKVYPLRDVNDQDKSIVIIPNVASGRPTVTGTGIRVEVIWNRSKAGESPQELAEDYGIEPRVIEKAISYFTNVKAA